MRIVSSAELRANQKKYFKIAETETVYVSRRDGVALEIKAAREKDIPTRAELESIQRGLDDIRNGRTFTKLPGESFDEFLKRVSPCIE